MKKIVLICLSLAISASIFAQENKDGKLQGEVLYLDNGVMLRKGSGLRLNGPLGENNRFKYIHHAPDNLFDDVKASSDKPAEPYYAMKEVTVRKIRYVGDKKEGSNGRWMVRLRTGDKVDFLCDIVDALNSGELSAMQTTITTVTPQVGATQELPQQTATPQAPYTQVTPTTPVVTQTPQPENKAATPAFSVADELLKLKTLMDEGLITKEEFEAQKKKLLEM